MKSKIKKLLICAVSLVMAAAAISSQLVFADEEISPGQETVPAVSAEESAEETTDIETDVYEEPFEETQEETGEEPEEKDLYYSELPAAILLMNLDFSSRRIIVGTEDPEIFADESVILSSYNDLYLLQFEDEQTAKKAYLYYYDKADLVDIDSGIQIAEDTENAAEHISTDTVMTVENNPFSGLAQQLEAEKEEAGGYLPEEVEYDIALIDTGVGSQLGIDGISFIGDDPADDNGHGTDMARTILAQNPDARILSIKVLDSEGKGDITAVYAGLEYAIEHNIPVANLSMSARASRENSILGEAVRNSRNTLVVGAAGNNGKNARYYVPGMIEDAIITGACDAKGNHLRTSNWGESLDFDVVAGSTSEAAATMSGWLTLHTLEETKAMVGKGLFYEPAAERPEGAEEELVHDDLFHTTATLINTGVGNVTGYKYVVRSNQLFIEDAAFTAVGGGSFAVSSTVESLKDWNDPAGATYGKTAGVIWNGGTINNTTQNISGGFKLRWPNVVYDAISGENYDLELYIHDIKIQTSGAISSPYTIVYNGVNSAGWGFDEPEKNGHNGYVLWQAFRDKAQSTPGGNRFWATTNQTTITIYPHGSDTPAEGKILFGSRDIDQPDWYRYYISGAAARGDPYNWSYNADGYIYPYTESIGFLEDPGTVWVNNPTWIRGSESRYIGTGDDDEMGWRSGLTTAINNGATVKWTGTNCGTAIFSDQMDEVIPGMMFLKPTVGTCSLKVAKTTTGLGADTSKDFTFTATALTGNDMVYKKYAPNGTQVSSGDGSVSGTPISQGGTFTLKSGQYVIISNITAGSSYTITESPDSEYTASGNPVSGTFPSASPVLTYRLNVTNSANVNQSGLNLTLTNASVTNAVTDGGGNISFTAQAGKTVKISGIPKTFKCTVTQTEDSAYTTSYSVSSGTAQPVTIGVDPVTVTALNTPKEQGGTVTNKIDPLYSPWKLKVSKSVGGNMGSRDRAFHFRITVEAPYIMEAKIYYSINGAEKTRLTLTETGTNKGTYDFTLTHADTVTFEGIPARASYIVTELDANKDGYLTIVPNNAEGTLTEEKTIGFINRRNAPIPTGVKISMAAGGGLLLAGLCASLFLIFGRRRRRHGN